MAYRSTVLAMVALALALFVAGPLLADQTHEGIVVKAGDGKLTMTGKDGKDKHTHDVAADVAITCDGKACKLGDLKEGFPVKVTMKDDKKTITKIEATSK